MLYLHLFHGRTHPNQQLDDWGMEGPTLGPFRYLHQTYAADLKGEIPSPDEHEAGPYVVELVYVNDLLYYGGVYYGDLAISDKADGPVVAFDASKAIPPKTRKPYERRSTDLRSTGNADSEAPIFGTGTPTSKMAGTGNGG